MRAREIWERWFVERGPLGPAAARELVLSLGEIRDRILAGALPAPGARVADVGCGRGLLAFAAADAVVPSGVVVGIDASIDPLIAATPLARETGVGFVCGDARRLPIPDGWADVVVWRSVLVYMERRADALVEALRVLTPGGRLSFSESLGGELEVPLKDPMLAELWAALKEFVRGALGESAFTPESLADLVAGAGFESVRCERERRRTRLPDARATRAFFEDDPPGGLSLAALWRACGIEEKVIEAFLEGVAAAAPLMIDTPEGYVNARRPG